MSNDECPANPDPGFLDRWYREQRARDERIREAAPELLKACRRLCQRMLVNELVGRTDGLGAEDQAAYDYAQRAIAKAEGMSNVQ